MLYDANDQPISQTDEQAIKQMPLKNYEPPTPKPEWFDKKVTDVFGYVSGTDKPKYRVVWGMDPNLTHFAMGKIRMKYPSVIDTIQELVGYNIIDTNTGNHQFVKKEKAESQFKNFETGEMTENIKPGVLIAPVIKEEEIEYGTPLWIVEQYALPEAFGTKEQWEVDRWLTNPENTRQYIDALGDYPRNGAWIHWFDIVDYNDKGEVEYRGLDESIIEWIRANEIANIARRKQNQFLTKQKRSDIKENAANEYWESQKDQIAREMLDVKKNKYTTWGDLKNLFKVGNKS